MTAMIDGNQAAAHIAYNTNEVIAIYPITPSSPMGEYCDEWALEGRQNIWGQIPQIVEMQSEAGAVAAVHGSLQAGCQTCTFTASQGLLLMIPNMFKIAGELTPTVFHIAARSIATHALSIFGDHSDVMAVRSTGFGMLCSNNVQEVMDMAMIAQMATLESRIPFLHFFDGFRTSHELNKAELLPTAVIRSLLPLESINAHRKRQLSPDHPVLRGTAQNPDVFFQGREASNPYYLACSEIVKQAMIKFGRETGRQYGLYDYHGHPEATDLVILMGSGCDTVQEAVDYLNATAETKGGTKVGVLKVRLFRPFVSNALLAAIPKSVTRIAVLDRTKEPGSTGEPLYLDVLSAFYEGNSEAMPTIVGGRYGLSSKEFTPSMAKAVFDNLAAKSPKNHFTIGINDDVTMTSLDWDPNFDIEPSDTVRAIFYGLGSDGTVSANKNSIKIIGEGTDLYAQGYFVYDSKKSGSVTISHLRFGTKPIHSSYLISKANFIACHQFSFLEHSDILECAAPETTLLINSPYNAATLWQHLPQTVQKKIKELNLKVYVIDAQKIAREAGLGRRINTILQVCFFAITKVIPLDIALTKIKSKIAQTYSKRGELLVKKNFVAVDATLEHLEELNYSAGLCEGAKPKPFVLPSAPSFVQNVLAPIIARKGDSLPVSAFPPDGTYPTGTAAWEKRAIAADIPIWDADLCIQCGKCIIVCPHSVIRSKIYKPEMLNDAPTDFKSATPRWKEFKEDRFTLQISPDDCTGCALCVEICPVKNKSNSSLKAINMADALENREVESHNWDFFETLPYKRNTEVNIQTAKDSQLLQPLFEFSGACAGCGETPYLKLLSQYFGDRAIIANATGCSSIYGGNLPTTPWTVNSEGRGPAWCNSLFEDNAEFGLGIRVAVDAQQEYATALLKQLAAQVGETLAETVINNPQHTPKEIATQREAMAELRLKLDSIQSPMAREFESVMDVLVNRSIWIIGGDGWAYDIGYGGLDHVLNSNRRVSILVLDTEVYSNTGGQNSKSTPRAAVAKYAIAGKTMPKKDLALLAIASRNVYVARVAFGANESQTIRALQEAENYPGPSLILAYSHCVAHGYDLVHGVSQQKLAVESGHWPLCRYNPLLIGTSEPAFVLDSKTPSIPLKQYAYNEARYSVLLHSNPEQAERLINEAQTDISLRWSLYKELADFFNGREHG